MLDLPLSRHQIRMAGVMVVDKFDGSLQLDAQPLAQDWPEVAEWLVVGLAGFSPGLTTCTDVSIRGA